MTLLIWLVCNVWRKDASGSWACAMNCDQAFKGRRGGGSAAAYRSQATGFPSGVEHNFHSTDEKWACQASVRSRYLHTAVNSWLRSSQTLTELKKKKNCEGDFFHILFKKKKKKLRNFLKIFKYWDFFFFFLLCHFIKYRCTETLLYRIWLEFCWSWPSRTWCLWGSNAAVLCPVFFTKWRWWITVWCHHVTDPNQSCFRRTICLF